MNLAINARDAMPTGGSLLIETANVALDEAYAASVADGLEPGDYLMIAVNDDGSGMAPEVAKRAFEPFFTTKSVGKGTGLGLSMVFGFVKQSGGHVSLYSEEGQGTTVRMYLPRAEESEEAHASAAPVEAARGHGETVLVVEDDLLVRAYAVKQVESLGYRAVLAGDANEALSAIARGTEVDLLFTDVVMPGSMNGRQLAEEVIKRLPRCRVLFTSGYTQDAMVHHGRLDPGVLLLEKPYRRSE